MIFISILILIVCISIPSIYTHISSNLIMRITTIIFIYAGALSLNVFYIQSIGSGIGIYSGYLNITSINIYMEIFILLIGSIILMILSSLSLQRKSEYSLIVLFSVLGQILLITSSDLISMYLSIELQSFAVYILTTLYRDSESATAAGLKYFLLGSLSSCIILLGCALIYSYTGITQLDHLTQLLHIWIYNDKLQGVLLGLALILIGYLFKVSAAPFHNWAPDVYDESPTMVTIWLTIMPKLSILIFLIELMGIGSTMDSLQPLLYIASFLSLIIGSIGGLSQNKLKRLLAFSTISHIGFILLSLSVYTVQSIDSYLIYIVIYTITTLNTFLIILAIPSYNNNIDSDIKYINTLNGLFFNNPILTISFTICLFSMAGVPPLIGFFSKQFVLYATIQQQFYLLSILAILVSVISASYYLKIIKNLHSTKYNNLIINKNINSIHSFMISTLTLALFLFILQPSFLLNSTQLLTYSLFNY